MSLITVTWRPNKRAGTLQRLNGAYFVSTEGNR